MEVTTQQSDIIASIVLNGDISKLTGEQRVVYVKQVCDRLGIDWTTQPFQILKLNGKERLYATKDATDQVRKVNGVSIYRLDKSIESGLCIFTAYAKDKTGKEDASSGAVPIEGLKGENLANAIMKAETKAKRRVTLSICGMGMLDENEVDSIQGAETKPVTQSAPAPIPAPSSSITDAEVVEDLSLEQLQEIFMDLLKEYESLRGSAASEFMHPDNWKTAKEAHNYKLAIKSLEEKLASARQEVKDGK